MPRTPSYIARWLLDGKFTSSPDHLAARWLFLRALGLIYFSAFYCLTFQIRGLIGPSGLLPAAVYLERVAQSLGALRFWFAPTLLWLGSGTRALELLCWGGMAAALLLTLNLWPRGTGLVCLLAYLSFIAAAQDFSDYQSDGMLLAAGTFALFLAPPGLRPGWGERHPPSRASIFLLQWEWFRIYFESGVAKIIGHDPSWRNLTAMDEYYQNGPLPTWIGWYVGHLPHRFHAGCALYTLAVEFGLVWMLFLPRRFRIACFFLTSPMQISIILTANYAFLNYLVLALGLFLLDDRFLARLLPRRVLLAEQERVAQVAQAEAIAPNELITLKVAQNRESEEPPHEGRLNPLDSAASTASAVEKTRFVPDWLERIRRQVPAVKMWASGIFLGWIFYATLVLLFGMILPSFPLPSAPAQALEPLRIANRYGLFGVMTQGRYEIEFQGSSDGYTWTAYPFRHKPQDLRQAPGIYAPYQPRFDWNLWFASLGSWREYPFVLRTEELLLENDREVLALFGGNPFSAQPPREIRAVVWRYWFTSNATRRTEGLWWRRELVGLYAPVLEKEPDGRFGIVQLPLAGVPPH